MIAAMLNIDELQQTIMVVIAETENLDRMKEADPITLESKQKGGILPAPKYPQNFSVLIAYEADQPELYKRVQIGGPQLLAWLERGRKWIPGKDGASTAVRIPRVTPNGK